MNSKIFLIMVFLLTSIARAGQEKGNGGDVIYCSESGKVMLYDYYEWSMLGIDPNLGSGSTTVDENVKSLIGRLANVAPLKADIIHKYYSRFYKNNEAVFLDNINLEDTDDLNPPFIEVGCEVKQAAVNIVPQIVPEAPVYKFDNKIWKQLGKFDPQSESIHKAGLIFHELLYRKFVEEQKNSDYNSWGVRYVNAMLAADKLKGLKTSEVFNRFQKARFGTLTYQNTFQIDLTKEYSFYSMSGNDEDEFEFLEEAYLAEELEYKLLNQTLTVNANKVRLSPLRDRLIAFSTDTPLYINNKRKFNFAGSIELSIWYQWVESVTLNQGKHRFFSSFYSLDFDTSYTKDNKVKISFEPTNFNNSGVVHFINEISISDPFDQKMIFTGYIDVKGGRFHINQKEMMVSKILSAVNGLGLEDLKSIEFQGQAVLYFHGEKVTFKKSLHFDRVNFMSQTYLAIGFLKNDAFLKRADGSYMKCQANSLVAFDENGYLQPFSCEE